MMTLQDVLDILDSGRCPYNDREANPDPDACGSGRVMVKPTHRVLRVWLRSYELDSPLSVGALCRQRSKWVWCERSRTKTATFNVRGGVSCIDFDEVEQLTEAEYSEAPLIAAVPTGPTKLDQFETLLNEFDNAAQGWGWTIDQGASGVDASRREYEEAKRRFTKFAEENL